MSINAASFHSAAQNEKTAAAQRAADARKKLLKGASEIEGASTPEESLLIGQWMDSRHSQVLSEDEDHTATEVARLGFFQGLGLAVEVRHEQGVFVLEAVQNLQNGRAVVVKTVVAPPLQIADLHGHLRQLESVGIDFNGLQLRHARLAA